MDTDYNIELDSFALFRIIFWVISVPYFVVFSCLFYAYRQRYIIKRRFPSLVHFFNIFFLIQFTQTVLPYFPCFLYTIIRWMLIPCLALNVLFRCVWALAKKKLQETLKFEIFESTGSELPKITITQKLLRENFLLLAYILGQFVYLFIYFMISIPTKEMFFANRPSYGILHCDMGNWNWVLTGQLAAYAIVFLLVAFFFRKLNEELFIRREMFLLSLVAGFVVISTIVIEFLLKDNPKLESNLLATVNGIALMFGFACTTIFPVFYACKSPRIDSDEFELPSTNHPSTISEETSLENYEITFKMIFESNELREEFRNYLMLEFCLENLLFLEAVEAYKKTTDKEEIKRKADKMRKKFIGPSSRTPINISGAVADEIIHQLDEHQATPELFDTAEKQVYHLLKVDPFPRFCIYRNNKH